MQNLKRCSINAEWVNVQPGYVLKCGVGKKITYNFSLYELQ